MADCSKTEVFLAEWERMCDTVICDDCDMRIIVDGMKCTSKALCMLAVLKRKEEAIKIVQKWSDEHPLPKPKTYADDFFEKFPKATRYRYGENNIPSFCVDNYYALGKRSSCNLECHSCWNEPYEV